MKEQNIRELLIHFIDSIRDYESESHNNIGFDDRESDELVDIYLKHNPELTKIIRHETNTPEKKEQ